MADSKISALTELAEAPAAGDLIPLVDVSDTTQAASGTTKRITKTNLLDGLATSGHTHSVALDDISDVTITSVSSGQVLKWNGSAWVNDTDATGGGAANAFTTIAADSGTNPQPESTTDTLTIAGGTGIDTVGDSSADSITVSIDSTVATKTGTETLTNKTLTAPAISSPTGLVKGDVGLGNVDNTSDVNKPISTATQAALDDKADLVGGLIPTAQIPALAMTSVQVAADEAAHLALTAERGDVVVRTDESKTYIHNGGTAGTMADWTLMDSPDAPVTTVNGQAGTVVLDAADVDAEPEGAVATHAGEADPHTGYQKESEKGAASGYASLDADTKVPFAELPTGTAADEVSIGNHTHSAPSLDGLSDVAITSASDGDVLTYDSTNGWQNEAPAGGGGGQTLYDIIVDAGGGGDYTTLGAAVTAASAGQSIFVKSGTYSESAINIDNTNRQNITIVGENSSTTIIAMGANNFTWAGAYGCLQGLKITATTATITLSGTESRFTNLRVHITGDGTLTGAGTNMQMRNCHVLHDGTHTTNPAVSLNGANASYIGNTFVLNTTTNTTEAAAVYVASTAYRTIANNHFIRNTTGSGKMMFIDQSQKVTLTGNTFQHHSSAQVIYIKWGQQNIIANNYFSTGYRCIDMNANIKTTISDNTIIAGGSGMCIYANGTNSDITISGNYLESGASGVIDFASTINNGLITGNRVKGTSGTGINLSSGTGTVVTGNQIGGVSGSSGSGVNIGANYVTITGNNFTNLSTGVEGGGKYSTVSGNVFDSTVTTPIASTMGIGNTVTDNSRQHAMSQKTSLFVKNTTGTAISQGHIVKLRAIAAGNEVEVAATADQDLVGVADEAISATTGTGYIVNEGKTVYLKVNGTTDIAVGDYITVSATAGVGQKAASGEWVIARAMEAYTTDDANGVIDALVVKPFKL